MNLHIHIERAEITVLPTVPTSELIASTLGETNSTPLPAATADTFTFTVATPRFVIGDGIVTDTRTGLQWSRDDVTEEAVDYDAAAAACSALRIGGNSDWRLPSRDELEALLDLQRHEPAIDAGAFPSCKSAYYWTSTPYAPSPSCAWCVGFDLGNVNGGLRDFDLRVRAVRGPVRQ